MSDSEYLNRVLNAQKISEDSDEIAELRQHRKEIEDVLRDKYGSIPTITYGGSKAKHTMILSSYDLDIIVIFPRNSTVAGATLKDIYTDVAETLSDDYYVDRKRTALKIQKKAEQTDLYIDVVPGRFIEDSEDANLYQNGVLAESLKTNTTKQCKHIRDSGVRDSIKLAKLWKFQHGLVAIKTFVLELLVVEVLKDKTDATLSDQFEYFLVQLRDHIDDFSVQDPANPNGNDLSIIYTEANKLRLTAVARTSLESKERGGWEDVFDEPISEEEERKSAAALLTTTNKGRPLFTQI